MIDDKPAGTIRLQLLLKHLDTIQWRLPLRHIGLQTATVAEALGLIEVTGDKPNRLYRLTAAGVRRRDKVSPSGNPTENPSSQ
jgi:hypothetical protein